MMNESDRFLRLIFRQMSAILCTTPTEESCHAEDDAATRQTISNLENKRIHITKTTYIAMRFVLDEEIEDYPDETEMLKAVLDSFVDNPDKYTDEQREEIRKKTELLSSAVKTKTVSRKEANNEWKALLALSIVGGSVMGIISSIVLGAWRNKK